MRFELQLLHDDLISAEQLVAAIELQMQEMPQLGQVAIEEGKLTVRQLFSILRVQADLPHDRFGETAVELEMLTREEVAELLLIQSDRKRPLHEILVDAGAISEETVDSKLEAYKRGMENGNPERRRISKSSFLLPHLAARPAEERLVGCP